MYMHSRTSQKSNVMAPVFTIKKFYIRQHCKNLVFFSKNYVM